MKFVRLQLFFKSRAYRHMCFQCIKSSIEYFIKTPFVYAKAIYGTLKLYIAYPNRWDRYVKVREIKNKAENEKAKEFKAIAHTNFIGALFRFDLSLLAYCDYINRDDITNENYETLYVTFNQAKEDFKKYANELEEMDVVIPYELKAMVEETDVDRFSDFSEYKIFSDKIHALRTAINVTYN